MGNMYEEDGTKKRGNGDYTVKMYKKREEAPSNQVVENAQPSIQEATVEGQSPNVDFVEELTTGNPYLSYWENAFNFKGRTSRGDYWIVVLINVIITIPLIFVRILLLVWCIITFIPSTAMMARRLRDAGFSPYNLIWYNIVSLIITLLARDNMAWSLLGFIIFIIMLVLLAGPSKKK